MLFGMSKPLLESFAATTDLLVKLFAILAAISALLYFFSTRQLQKVRVEESSTRPLPEQQPAPAVQSNAALLEAQTEIQKLKLENANLTAELQQEHEARLLTQWRLGPRFIPPATRPAMIDALQPFAGHRLNFGYFTDLETAAFAEDLLDAIKAAGWKPQVFKIKTMQPMYGIECGGPNPQDPALEALTGALKLVDQRLLEEDDASMPAEQTLQSQLADQVQMWVMVGLKRPHLRRKLPTDTVVQPPAASNH